jgi:superfamily II DNA or RNA helicase
MQVASTQTLLDRDLPPASFVIVDEAHHYPSQDTEWGSIVAAYGPQKSRDPSQGSAVIIGLTATPERGDGVGLSQFDAMVVAAQPRELVQLGHLCPVEVYRPSNPTKALSMDPVAAYQKFGDSRKAIIFPSSIRAATDIEHRLNALGIPARAITQRTPEADREVAVDRFRGGSLQVLIGVHVLTEGLDVPDAYLAILGTACASPGSLMQKAGRVMRPHPSKTHCRLADLMGSTWEHGLPDDDREFSLLGTAIRSRSDLPPQIQCEACGRVFRGDEFVDNACPGCGAIKRGRVDPRIRERAVELAKAERAKKYPPGVVEFLANTIELAVRNNWPKKRKGVQMKFLAKFHHYPSNALIERAGGWRGL